MDIAYILTVLGVILVSMMLHEVTHGFIALKLGDDTAKMLGRLSLNPLKHIDPFMTILLPLLIIMTNVVSGTNMPIFGGAKPVPFNQNNIRNDWGVALIAISGPLVNLLIAFICYGILFTSGLETTNFIGSVITVALWVNLGFFAFNIIPIPPLDGSRVLYALAPEFVRGAMNVIEKYGSLFILVIVMLFSNFIITYISGFINIILIGFSRLFSIF